MTKIGLVGIPGSGKTLLAQAIKKALEEADDKNLLPVTIIDGYVEDLQKEIDLALSWHGTYIGNAHVALKRESLERNASKDFNTIITCGTLYETSSYTGQYMQEEYEILTEDDDEKKYDLVLRVEAMTRMLACLYTDTMRYDHLFYLPPVQEAEDVRARNLDRNLQAAFNGFELEPITKLIVDGNNLLEITENRLNIVLEKVLDADKSEK